MLFTSPTFLTLFLPLVLIINILLQPKYRNVFLLIASIFFYMWGEGTFVIIMLCSIAANYLFGLWIEKSLDVSEAKAKLALFVAIGINVALLVYFKYSNFIADNLNVFGFEKNGDFARIHLPLGISFFTFENISYCFDVYRKQNKAQKSLTNYGLFVTLFPHLIAGPIVKYHSLAEQIENRSTHSNKYREGIIRFSIGLFKKLFIANNIAFIADIVFNDDLSQITLFSAWIAIIAYSLQIYFDFSGYSDMAIGIAKLFGFDLIENFNYPYVATSIQDFWRRWHISLTTWFREYLYIPLGGNRNGKFKTYRNLFIVFLCTGIWHGASWNFIIWGFFHGFFIIIERMNLLKFLEIKKFRFLAHTYTILVLITGWTFFRIESLQAAISFLQKMIGIGTGDNNLVFAYLDTFHVFIFGIGILFCTPVIRNFIDRWEAIKIRYINHARLFVLSEIVFTSLLIVFTMHFNFMEIAANSYNPFIYFRF